MRTRLPALLLLLFLLLALPGAALAADPTVTVGFLPVATKEATIIVRGTAPRGQTVAISVNGELQARVIAGPSMDVYRYTVSLSPGENQIAITLEGSGVTLKRTLVRTTASFSDLDPNDPATEDIEMLASLGVVNGIGDGRFGPELNLTRAQFAKLLALGLGLSPALIPPAFADAAAIPDWARGYVATAVAQGLIKGYEDGTFKPDNLVTRAEVAVIAARAVLLKGIGQSREPLAFTDAAQIPVWAQADVATAIGAGIIEKYWGAAFEPTRPASRALAAGVIRRLWSAVR